MTPSDRLPVPASPERPPLRLLERPRPASRRAVAPARDGWAARVERWAARWLGARG